MSKNKVVEQHGDLTARPSQLEQLDRPKLVAPRQSTEQGLTPSQEQPPLRDVVVHRGRMYALAGSEEGPHFKAATWLRPARRAVR